MNCSEADLHVLAARVQKLETQNRRWKLCGTLLVLFGASFLLTGAKPADRIDPPVIRATSVEAQEFILKDENGHVRARLSLSPGSNPGQLNGRSYVVPGQKATGAAALEFYDERGELLWTAPSNPTMIPVR